MPLFGRKKKVEEKIHEKLKFPELKELSKPEKREEITKPASAPLFVKLERYKDILDTVSEIKMTMIKMRNAISILSELNNLINENLKMIKEAIDMMDKKIASLDSEFIKPPSLQEKGLKEPPKVTEEFGGGLSDVLSNLKNQVSQLKSELQSISKTEK